MEILNDIVEYPYQGTIISVTQGKGKEDDKEEVIYEGVMDEHLQTPMEGREMQTSEYIISMPLVKDSNGSYIVPKKGDKIEVMVYGIAIRLVIDNVDPSQLGGITITATRKSW